MTNSFSEFSVAIESSALVPEKLLSVTHVTVRGDTTDHVMRLRTNTTSETQARQRHLVAMHVMRTKSCTKAFSYASTAAMVCHSKETMKQTQPGNVFHLTKYVNLFIIRIFV